MSARTLNNAMTDEQAEQFGRQVHDRANPSNQQIDSQVGNLRKLADAARESADACLLAKDTTGQQRYLATEEELRNEAKRLSKTKSSWWSRLTKRASSVVGAIGRFFGKGAKAGASGLSAVGTALTKATIFVGTVVVKTALLISGTVIVLFAVAVHIVLFALLVVIRVVQFGWLLLCWPKNAIDRNAKAKFGRFFAMCKPSKLRFVNYLNTTERRSAVRMPSVVTTVVSGKGQPTVRQRTTRSPRPPVPTPVPVS